MTATWGKGLTALVVVLAMAGLSWQAGWWNDTTVPQAAAQKAAVKVITQPVVITANDRLFEAVGTGRAKYSAEIYPAVAEEVTAVLFTAQQQVAQGELLVQLDDRQERVAVRLAEVAYEDAKTVLDRYQNAFRGQAVPETELDSARAAFESAQLDLDQARLDLADRRITAPFAGVVGIPNVDPGDRVGVDTLITGLDARETLYVDFEVPEALAAALKRAEREHQTVTVLTPSYPERVFDGHISAQESRLNPQRRTLLARASIDNSDDLLRPGMSFTVRWNIPGADYPMVPEIALQWGRDGSYVWIVRDGKAAQVMARVVARKAGRVLLDGDIAAAEPVVVEGVQRLRPHVAVAPVASGPVDKAEHDDTEPAGDRDS